MTTTEELAKEGADAVFVETWELFVRAALDRKEKEQQRVMTRLAPPPASTSGFFDSALEAISQGIVSGALDAMRKGR